ncbi:MAG: DNA cytosine methyltransferase [Lentisphaeria bacterium]
MKNFRFVDLFCGGGGSITGAINALNSAGMQYEGRGFNHWDVAIRTIQANHPEVVPNFDRACTPIEAVLPDEIFDIDPGRIDCVWASPSCTHHSNAAGGKPRSNQLRSQPEYLLPYLRLTKCRRMFVENVRELRDWGPLLDKDTVYHGKCYKAGQVDPRKKGVFFNLWLREIKASGYHVDMAVMNAADYGAATSRERLIIQSVRKSSGERIIWPEPTHAKEPGLFNYKPWRPASEIIDWSIHGESIFNRKKPLCENTLRRIEAGIRKFWGAWAEPFIIVLRGTKDYQIESSAIKLSSPLPVITAGGQHISLIRPFLSRYNGGNDRNHGIDEPMPVIDTSNRYSVIQPLFVPQQSAGTVKPIGYPLPTISTSGAIGLVEPLLLKYYGNDSSLTSTRIPLGTITTKDRFGLIRGQILTLSDGQAYNLDITHRMLTVAELAAATGFPAGYKFFGSDTAAKKQIGNAVCPDLAAAIYLAILNVA